MNPSDTAFEIERPGSDAAAPDTASVSVPPANIYHLHPLVAGPLATWAESFGRIAGMGFNHACLAPPFEPGPGGDIFTHFTFERLHPALGFSGQATEGLSLASDLASRAGLRFLVDVTPGRLDPDSLLVQRSPEWFDRSVAVADPRRKPRSLHGAAPRFDHAEGLLAWWVSELTALVDAGVRGFRCLTLDLVPAAFWRRLIQALPEATFLAWTPDLSSEQRASFIGTDFDLTCQAAGRDGLSAAFFDEQDQLRRIAPFLATPEPSIVDRLAQHLPPDADIASSYRMALGLAAATSSGLFIPMGFEFATRRRFDPVRASPADLDAAREETGIDLSDDLAAAIHLVQFLPPANIIRLISPPDSVPSALLRAESADIRDANQADLVLINSDILNPATLRLDGTAMPPASGASFVARGRLPTTLRPGEIRIVRCDRADDITGGGDLSLSQSWARSDRIAVENVQPVVPDGAYAAKTVIGRPLSVSADIFSDGHDVLAADLLWRSADSGAWQRIPMRKIDNDQWVASVCPNRIGLYRFAVEAWWDQWGTFTHDLRAKLEAGQSVDLEIREGRAIIEAVDQATNGALRDWLTGDVDTLLSAALAHELRQADYRPFATKTEVYGVRADRPAAEFASWYELFPRSATGDKAVHGTFRSVIERMPEIRAMGFDVLYFPPIHPIGVINRKGRNNALKAEAGDVGSPYAIGSADGGHDSVHPALGSLDDFRAMVVAAHDHGLEIALDFAVQCAPDHPWVSEHPDWFRWRPDGSMRYAENPPKKYEDIVNPDFYGETSFPAVWLALRDVIQFWVDQGVRIFRVDNPHTKPLPFWQWMIADIQDRHPDVLFLAEAFTRPKPMYRLAKAGFSQSYTYFTWRTSKKDLTDYLMELTTPPVSRFFRPNFFVNTPDINPVYLQTSGRPGFLIRAALAATLSGLWGVYSGFEICEAAALPGREEYLDSEKYEIRPRDYRAPGNIVAEITALNRIRRLYPALQSHLGVRFHDAGNDQIILYSKCDSDGRGLILIAVNLDPHSAQEATIDVPLWLLGLTDAATVAVTELMRNVRFTWTGKYQRIHLDPADLPFSVWRVTGVR